MATLVFPPSPPPAGGTVLAPPPVARLWPTCCAALGMFSIIFGLYWDVSWHMSIGRDTFWTPAHLAIQFGGVLAAAVSGYLIFSTSLASGPAAASARARAVRVWGFQGPLGAFVAAWGGATMATSAPFDDWWHKAYGVDVQILSPPHAVLTIGFAAVSVGALLLTASERNRACGLDAARERHLQRLLVVQGGLFTALHLILVSAYLGPNLMHGALFYRVTGFITPAVLLMVAAVAGQRWAATKMAALYMALMLAGLWILPSFAAQPRLGPVYTPITHMVTLPFPLLLILPAALLDLGRPRLAGRTRHWQAVGFGLIFLGGMLVAQWPWADFLMLPLARNRAFGMTSFAYSVRPSQYYLTYRFIPPSHPLWMGFGLAAAVATLSCWCGLWAGEWLRKLQR